VEFPRPIYAEIFERALPHLQTRHNEVHTRASYRFGVQLLAEERGDPEVVIPAILLHDLGWSRVPEDRQLEAFGPTVQAPELTRLHESEGAAMAMRILQEVGYPLEPTREIVEIVGGHDTRLESLGPNDSLVKDADKLFRLSREGFPIDCRRFGLEPSGHLAWLEKRIAEWFFTATAVQLAHAEVEDRREELSAQAEPDACGMTCR
jgi:hypothetical protein